MNDWGAILVGELHALPGRLTTERGKYLSDMGSQQQVIDGENSKVYDHGTVSAFDRICIVNTYIHSRS